jgi:hypothetical protein
MNDRPAWAAHRYQGLCPDVVEGWDSRDPECPACQWLDRALIAESAIADRDAAIRAIVGELRAEIVGQVDLDALAVLDDVLGEGWAAIPWCSCGVDGDHLVGAVARAHALALPPRVWPEWWGSVLAYCVGCGEARMQGGEVLDVDGEVARTLPGEDGEGCGRCWCDAGTDDECKGDGSEPCPYND